MTKLPFGLVGAMVALTACQTTPPTNPALEEARSAVSTAAADPAVNTAAPQDLQRARDALAVAERAWAAGDDTETRSRAHIARQRANIASEIGARYTTEQRLQQVTVERERVRTEARAREAQLAQQRATEANQQAASAQAQAATAQAQAATAQAQADAERQRVEEQARQLAAQKGQLDNERERAAQMQKDLEALAAKQTARGVVVTLQDVLFDVGKAQLRSGGVRSLERVAGVLKNYPERRVLVEGFTDSQGSDSYNVELSQRRANAVKEQLETLGVPDQRIETRAHGEAYPVADNGSPVGRQQNRRVEILFSDGQGHFSSR